jgi:hypothetical protein
MQIFLSLIKAVLFYFIQKIIALYDEVGWLHFINTELYPSLEINRDGINL